MNLITKYYYNYQIIIYIKTNNKNPDNYNIADYKGVFYSTLNNDPTYL